MVEIQCFSIMNLNLSKIGIISQFSEKAVKYVFSVLVFVIFDAFVTLGHIFCFWRHASNFCSSSAQPYLILI